MKALVTGGAGFIGSHLVDGLLERGAEVHVLDDLSSGSLRNVHPQAVFHIASVCSAEAAHIIRRENFDTVFHLAAQADVQRSIRDPGRDAAVNIGGTLNVLQASRDSSVRKVIFASTSGVYGNLQKDAITEDDPADPVSYYGLSKWAAEAYIRLYYQLYGLPYTILRYGNVYGPRQTVKGEGGVVALFIDKIRKGLPVTIHGDGNQTRDFVYVADVVRANMAALERGDQEIIHVGTTRPTSVNRLVSLLSRISPATVAAVYGQSRPGDIRHSCLNHDKAIRLLKWEPQVELPIGLRSTMESS